MNIYEVLDYGPIVAKDDAFEVLVTANGSYLNFWISKSKNEWENTDTKVLEVNYKSLPMREVVRRAEKWLEECMQERFED